MIEFTKAKPMKLKIGLGVISLLWVMLITASFFWNYTSARNQQQRMAFQTARSFFDLIVMTREWNARHGGVYVPVTRTTRPNPYLKSPSRDLLFSEKLTLTLVNPAFMTRQISEIAEKRDISFHITSMRPVRPENRPTQREAAALKAFEKGVAEQGAFIMQQDGGSGFFYMAPLKTKKTCLKCHAEQGYQEGEIRGGISITLPFAVSVPMSALLLGHMAIAVLGLIGIAVSGIRLQGAYEIIRRQAVSDALTGLANRRSFSDRIEREFKRARRHDASLALLLCDIDHFKIYNDTYGHAAGDECLRMVADQIRRSLKRPSDFCARYGGEEFIVILPETSLSGARQIAEQIRQNIEDLAVNNEKAPTAESVTVSLGVAATENTAPSSHEQLIQYADKALYRAKAEGRNRVVCFEAGASVF